MKLRYHKHFSKQVEKLLPAQKRRLKATLSIFQEDPYHPLLYNHALKGEWGRYRSISFGGDWRVHYRIIDNDTALFVAVGTHSQLYK
ncbi:MAG: type II toxin-antitoxin system mRNA interferase toxin, RelE/StbE family [Candidatus Saccharimonadales bacterium]